MMIKSPFVVVQDFLSPLQCEKIIDTIHVDQPDVDKDGTPRKTEKHNLFLENDIAERFRSLIPDIEQTYDCAYHGLEKPLFQYYPENAKTPADGPGCENAKYLRKKWVQYKDVDLVGFIWLKDYNDNVPIDTRYEVFGGKLEFPVYNFSLVPQRGTLVVFPAGPHFITVISPILLSDLYQIKLNISIKATDGSRWLYQPSGFGGDWKSWFEGHF
jgi:hypothetical protein